MDHTGLDLSLTDPMVPDLHHMDLDLITTDHMDQGLDPMD